MGVGEFGGRGTASTPQDEIDRGGLVVARDHSSDEPPAGDDIAPDPNHIGGDLETARCARTRRIEEQQLLRA